LFGVGFGAGPRFRSHLQRDAVPPQPWKGAFDGLKAAKRTRPASRDASTTRGTPDASARIAPLRTLLSSTTVGPGGKRPPPRVSSSRVEPSLTGRSSVILASRLMVLARATQNVPPPEIHCRSASIWAVERISLARPSIQISASRAE